MKYYLDTEFIEAQNTIDLISISIKCEDGRTFYAESTCFDERKASDWVMDNVILKLKWYGIPCQAVEIKNKFENGNIDVFGSLNTIKKAVLEFIGDDKPEFWGYYADYDWVVFCWLFGSMVDLPDGWPMYCKDLKQLLDEIGNPSVPAIDGEHNALVDAIWSQELHEFILEYED